MSLHFANVRKRRCQSRLPPRRRVAYNLIGQTNRTKKRRIPTHDATHRPTPCCRLRRRVPVLSPTGRRDPTTRQTRRLRVRAEADARTARPFPSTPRRGVRQRDSPRGAGRSGADAVYHIWRRLPLTRWIAWVYNAPGIHWVSNRAYGWIAANRFRLIKPEDCDGVCEIPPRPAPRPVSHADD